MIKIMNYFKENKLLLLMIMIYLSLMIAMPSTGFEAVNASVYYIIEMIMIMPVIFILTGLLEAWVPKESIMNNLGENSGIKGMFFSFLLGSFSAGPIYAAFPICILLLKKGAKIANIVIILSAWAVIKIPMLINEAQFLGLGFTAIRWVLTTISIFIIAYLVNLLVTKKDIPNMETEQSTERVSIDTQYCVGCTICKRVSPSIFEIKDKKAYLKTADWTEENLIRATEAAKRCPAKVIQINEEAGPNIEPLTKELLHN